MSFFNQAQDFWDKRSVRTRSIVKLVAVSLAWWAFDEWGNGIAPLFNTLWLAIGVFFCLSLGNSWKFWAVFIPAGYLANFYGSGFFSFFTGGSWSSFQFSNLMFFVPTIAFLKRAILGK